MSNTEERDPFVGDDPQKPQEPKKNGECRKENAC